MNQLSDFSILASPAGTLVEIDGQDISDKLEALQFTVGPDGVPKLTLYEKAAGNLSGQAFVQVHVGGEQGLANAIAIINEMDRPSLHSEVLESLGWDSDPAASTDLILKRVIERLENAGRQS